MPLLGKGETPILEGSAKLSSSAEEPSPQVVCVHCGSKGHNLTDCPDITYEQLGEVLINLWEIQDHEEKERSAMLIQMVCDRDKQASCLV